MTHIENEKDLKDYIHSIDYQLKKIEAQFGMILDFLDDRRKKGVRCGMQKVSFKDFEEKIRGE